jgi:LVIVD repeat
MKSSLNALLILCIFLSSCNPVTDFSGRGDVAGYVPVYSADVKNVKKITARTPQPTVNGGKLYTVGKLLFQVELDSGIHIIDYTNPSNPIKIGFIKSFLCKEVSVKNGFIYTNNLADLVVIDISDISNVHEVARTPNVFPDLTLQFPAKVANQFEPIYFECPDPSKGVVIAWKQQTLTNPKCRR